MHPQGHAVGCPYISIDLLVFTRFLLPQAFHKNDLRRPRGEPRSGNDRLGTVFPLDCAMMTLREPVARKLQIGMMCDG